MIEIDHSLLNATESLPEPARPVLATHLLELEEKQRRRFAHGNDHRVRTECTEVDELLGGGLERGILVGISAEGNERRLISLHLLASILVSHLRSPASISPKIISRAIIIDTTGSFPLALLAKVLKARLAAANAKTARAGNQTGNFEEVEIDIKNTDDVDADVQKCLEMVAISRVFDIEGLWEVLGEVGRDSRDVENDTVETDQDHMKPWEILDSEDDLTDDEDMAPAAAKATDEIGTEIIIVDNLTHIINELFTRKEKGDAHELLSLLSQTLFTLAQSQNILTILHNTAVPAKSTYNPEPPNPREDQQQQPPPPKRKPQTSTPAPKSIFPSNPHKPSLGHIFAHFPTLHLFLSSLPKTREDAELAVYGQGQPGDPDLSNSKTATYCTVLEVLKDEAPILGADRQEGRRFGWREQRWTALDVDVTSGDGTALVGAFRAKGNRGGMGMGLERERERYGALTDVSAVAKMNGGFGGRRV